jgi:hypothetical protein
MAALKLPCCLHQQQVSASCPNPVKGRSRVEQNTEHVRQLCFRTNQANYLRVLDGGVSRCERFLAVTTSGSTLRCCSGDQIALSPANKHEQQPINARFD